MKPTTWLLLLAAFLSTTVQADLVLNIDTDAKQVYFTGSMEVTPGTIGEYTLYWNNKSSAAPGEWIALESDMLTASQGWNGYITNLRIYNDDSIMVGRTMSALTGDPFTLTGTGVKKSYTSLFDPFETALENYTGGALTPASPLGMTSNGIQVNVIPEPSSVIMISVASVAGFFMRRRFRR